MTWREDIVSLLGASVELDAPLASRVAFRIGGPADAFAKPKTAEQLAATLELARRHAVPVTLLGTGSNVLIADAGIRGITVRLAGELAAITVADDGSVVVGAGALNAPLVARALDASRVGIEFLATIPGTFGGALIMNAGAHGGEIGEFVREVTLVNAAGVVERRAGGACSFAYRSSGFTSREILTGAVLDVPRGDVAEARAHLAEMRGARRATQPIGEPNAGSIFKNPPGDYAGRLIEACDLKGEAIGGARISELHANFIVNVQDARAADVIALAELAIDRVRDRFAIDLVWEVQRLGDFDAGSSSVK